MLLPPTLVFELVPSAECDKNGISEDTPSGNNNGTSSASNKGTPSIHDTPSMEIHYTADGRPLVTPAYLASLAGWRQDPLIASALYKLYEFVDYEDREGTSHQAELSQTEASQTEASQTEANQTDSKQAEPEQVKQEQTERSPRLYLYGEAKSSLDVAHDLARQGKLEPWDAVMVTSQSEGRGQLRREWDSPCGNLYAAWRLPLEFPMTEGYAALVVGSMIAEALSTIRVPIQLKWPNDLVLKGKKVGGILLEERGGVLLAGIGINVLSGPDESCLRDDHAIPATYLHAEGCGFTPLTLFCSLVNMGRVWYGNQVHGKMGANFPQCMEKYLAWRHQNIVVHGGNSDIKNGTIVGIAPCGGLKVLDNGVEKILDSGSIVLE